MPHSRRIPRRAFLGTAALGIITARASRAASKPGPWVCAFSKHLQFINDYAELAKTARALGLDGLDVTVRKGGHVEPATVAVDLPRCVEAVRAEGLDVLMVTTALKRGDDPDARPILDTASRLGIRYARIGGHQYSKDGVIVEELKRFTDDVRSLAEILQALGVIGGYHNHSGGTNFGAPMWDMHHMIASIGNDSLGSNFDVGHATVEGGLGAWRLNARLLAPHVKMAAVKDFIWENGKVRWVPLGQGQVNVPGFFEVFRAAGFAGPVSMHFEYDVASNDAMLDEIRAAAVRLRADLQKAGYSSV